MESYITINETYNTYQTYHFIGGKCEIEKRV